MRSLSRFIVFLAAFGCLFVQRSLQAQEIHNRLKKGGHRFQTILVLPSQISMARAKLNSDQGIPTLIAKLEAATAEAVAKEFSMHGVKVLPALRKQEEDTPEARNTLADLQRRYDLMDGLIVHDPAGIRKGRYRLGDAAIEYGPAASADTLVFIRGGLGVSRVVPGRMAFPAFTITQRQDKWHVTLVDARNGEVIAYIEPGGFGRAWKGETADVQTRFHTALLAMPGRLFDLMGKPH